MSSTSINEVGTVFVPVTDQERALEFYQARWDSRSASTSSTAVASRWLEVAPPAAANTISLVPQSRASSAVVRRGLLRIRDERHRVRPREPPAPVASSWTRRSRARARAGRA